MVARLASGQNDALGLIYDRHAPALFRVLSAILGSSADAEDALQETFVALATCRVSKIRDLRAYLFTAARHQAFTILRRRKREGAFEFSAEIAENEANDPPHDFPALLARLPLEQREVIALKVWEELSFAEIAHVIQISPNTAMSRYRYGIEKLRHWCREDDCDD